MNCVILGESEIQQKNVLLSVEITFQDTYSKGLIIFFVSNKLQKLIKNTDILASLSTNHSPISFTLRKSQIIAKSKGLWVFKAWAKREKQNKNLKFLIRFFVFRHLFPSCFSTNETHEIIENVFGSNQKHFCWKKHFLFDFFVSPSVFPLLQDTWFKHVAKRIEFTKTNRKRTKNLKRDHVY